MNEKSYLFLGVCVSCTASYEKPTAQTAHLVFADSKANAEKTKRAVLPLY